MSKYTTEVRYIVESASGLGDSVDYVSVNDVIKASLSKVFNFDFPIFDESYRSVLETKILKHYYTREIGLETVGLWKLKLDTRLNEIMPYYNQLYKTQLLEFNPFYDVDITRTRKGTINGNKNENGNERKNSNNKLTNNTKEKRIDSVNGITTNNINNTSKDVYSDTPQGALSGLESGEYMSNARIVTDSGVNTNNSNYNTNVDNTVDSTGINIVSSDTINSVNTVVLNTEEYLESVKGKQGTEDYSSLLLKYRQTFLNIDMMVIDELSDLFMNVW